MATPPVLLVEPALKRVVAFVDGQNLFYAAKEAFGYQYPNYDILKLAQTSLSAASTRQAAISFQSRS